MVSANCVGTGESDEDEALIVAVDDIKELTRSNAAVLGELFEKARVNELDCAE
jgi:hypothetical protein